MAVFIGTAGWSLPRAEQEHFPSDGTHLERYATRFTVAEINSSFHRSHRPTTWTKWRESVPASFRFSVKLPKLITHARGLKDLGALVTHFLEEVSALENKLGAFLVQLPPKLAFDSALAEQFFAHLRECTALPVACEPRHESWFGEAADRLLQSYQVARVAADPARVPTGGTPSGWRGFSYYRLHGSPRIYYSAYSREFLAALVDRITRDAADNRDVWVIFDNTTRGAATTNALQLSELLTSA